jgi:hypothetical protein
MCLEYNFDLKFGLKESTIKFENEMKSMSFNLPRGDEKEWRKILRIYLNQKGFH